MPESETTLSERQSGLLQGRLWQGGFASKQLLKGILHEALERGCRVLNQIRGNLAQEVVYSWHKAEVSEQPGMLQTGQSQNALQ